MQLNLANVLQHNDVAKNSLTHLYTILKNKNLVKLRWFFQVQAGNALAWKKPIKAQDTTRARKSYARQNALA